MSTYGYNDGRCCGGRYPRLYLAKGGEVQKFDGENIPGYCAVVTEQYEKAGKWSNTSYRLELAPGVRALYFLSPLHGTWGDNLGSWGEVAEELGLPVDVAQAIVRAEYPHTAKRLDDLEQFALAVEATGEMTTETVVISFGSPTNRSIREGFWGNPKSSRTSDGRVVTVAPGVMSAEEADRRAREWGERCGYSADSPKVAQFREELTACVGWDHPVIVEPEGAKVISSRYSPGMHGGYRTVEVAVPTAV